MDTLVGQKQVNVTDDAFKEWPHLITVESHRVKRRRGVAEISNVAHEDSILLHCVWFGNIRARGMQQRLQIDDTLSL